MNAFDGLRTRYPYTLMIPQNVTEASKGVGDGLRRAFRFGGHPSSFPARLISSAASSS